MKYKPLQFFLKVPLRNGVSKPKKVRGMGFKMVNMGEIFSYDRILNIDMDRVPLTTKEQENSLLKQYDLLFARQSLVLEGAGKCSIFLSEESDVCFESHLIRCRLDFKKINPLFLFYFFKSHIGRNKILSITEQGAGAAGIRGSDLVKIDIPLSPLKYQSKVVKILNDLDKKITLNNQINETLEAMAQAIFKSWFIDFEPVKAKIGARDAGQDAEGILLAAMSAISGKEIEALKVLQTTAPEEYAELKAIAEQFPDSLEESELGMIPKGWEVKSFFDWIEPKRGKNITKKKAIPGNVPVVAGGLEPAYYHNEYNVIGPAITISASGANAGFINLYFQNIWSSDSSYISSKETEYIFTAYVLLKLRQIDIFKMQTGAAQPHIYPKDFERLLFALPIKKLFSDFEDCISPIFKKIQGNNQQTKTLTELRDTLLPKLLSGEIDVSNVEIDELPEN